VENLENLEVLESLTSSGEMLGN